MAHSWRVSRARERCAWAWRVRLARLRLVLFSNLLLLGLLLFFLPFGLFGLFGLFGDDASKETPSLIPDALDSLPLPTDPRPRGPSCPSDIDWAEKVE